MDPLKKAYKANAMIGAGMIASLFIYAVMIELIRGQLRPFAGFARFPDLEMLRYLFFGLALLQIALIETLRRTLLRIGPSDDGQTLIRKLGTSAVVTYALCEVPAIYGLVLFFLGGLYRDSYLLLAYSLALLLIYFPRYARWEEWMRSSSRLST